MKRNARSAYNALKKIGAPVFERSDVEYFMLSAEASGDDGERWAYPFAEVGWYVDPRAEAIVEKCGLYLEWENGGGLIAYDRWRDDPEILGYTISSEDLLAAAAASIDERDEADHS